MISILYIVVCLAIVGACIRPLGSYMAAVYSGRQTSLYRAFGWLEQSIYSVCGIDPKQEMGWRGYVAAVLIFSAAGFTLLFLIFSFQANLPLNPQAFAGLAPDLAFNAAISFVTNTNWQSYGGESTLSYFSQAVGCAVQNFLSAATGMAVAVALFRALARKESATIGNFWVDMTRSLLYILLPLSFVFALFLVSQGLIQNLSAYTSYTPLEGNAEGLIAQGPVASQIAIKMLGSNGGGFFNTNGAHPFENSTPLSNLFQIIAILLIPAAFTYTFGKMVGDRRQGWSVLAAMAIIFLPLLAMAVASEQSPNPKFSAAIDQSAGNMEGKEVRFGAAASALWAVSTTATSNGSVNAMHDSFTPLGGLVPMLLMQFGEIVFGGVGCGMYGMLVFVLFTVFIGGLMVGRTPEYLGKKLGAFEIKMASIAVLVPAIAVLAGAALAVATVAGRAGLLNDGAQGFSEILYAFSSATNNNGSAFAGLSANTPFYNLALGLAMFMGRFCVIIAVLAIAGSLAAKKTVPMSAGTLPTYTPLFTSMLVGVIVLVGVLTFIPALALGPIAEHMHLMHIGGK